ncbi:MAG: hypothetical protein AAGA03_20565, partial [Planctomycetota bacterium]
EVIVITNTSDHVINRVTADINGQYFLYRDSPLKIGERLVVPQRIFKTKSNQIYDPKKYPVKDVTVTGQLPSGARGVTEVKFDD